MNIYTYYEDVDFKFQNQLLALWQQSWKQHGFTPVILSREDAKKSHLYQQYYDFVQDVHHAAVGQILPEKGYWLAAQLEIVAFHTIETPSYVSDYDMINNGFDNREVLESIVHWRNDACSCFASGDKLGWEKYIMFLIENKQIVVDWCHKTNQTSARMHFGDQDFLVAVRQKGIDNNIYKMYRNTNIAGADYCPNGPNTCKIIHLSHNNMGKIKKNHHEYADYDAEAMRVSFAKSIINQI